MKNASRWDVLRRRRKTFFLLFFSVLAVDLSFFTLFYIYPQAFAEYLISFEPEVLGLAIVGGFITAIASSAALLLLSYKELRTIMGKPLGDKVFHPHVEKE